MTNNHIKEYLVDFKAIFSDNDSPKMIARKCEALVEAIQQQKAVKTIKFSNLSAISDMPQVISVFSQLTHIQKFEHSGSNVQGDIPVAFHQIASRNHLIQLLNLNIDPGDDIWMQIIQQRLARPGLYRDNNASLGEMNLYSFSRAKNSFSSAVNFHVDVTVEAYLDSLLGFINEQKEIFEAKEGGFPYRTLAIARGYTPENLLAGQKTNKIQLEVLTRHLRRGAYFPFENIKLEFALFEEGTFPLLVDFLDAVSHCKQINSVHLSFSVLQPGNRCTSTDLTKQQYEVLQEKFDENNSTFDLVINSKRLADDVAEVKATLGNTIAKNRRDYKCRLRKGAPGESETEEIDVETTATTLIASVGSVRPYKFNEMSFRSQLNVDVSINQETQQQQQAAVTQVTSKATQVKTFNQADIGEFSADLGDSDLVDYKAYTKNNSNFNALLLSSASQADNSILMDSINKLLPQKALSAYWHHACSESALAHNVKYATSAAVTKLNLLPQHFMYGFNPDNMPIGFFVQQHPENGLILCYDETSYPENSNASPLTLRLHQADHYQNWVGDIRQFIPESKYDKTFGGLFNTWNDFQENQATLAKFKQFMRGLDFELAEQIINTHEWCFPSDAGGNDSNVVGELDGQRYFKDGKNIFALMDVMYHEGCEGVQLFLNQLKTLNAKDPDLYKHFKKQFIDNRISIKSLLMKDNLDALKGLADLSAPEKMWWMHLVEQHKRHVTQIDLAQLYTGFKYFLKQLPNSVQLPIPCPIDDCNNMLLTLDRLLVVLSKVKPHNLANQLEHLNDLSFNQEGVWYAARWDGFQFFHEAMGLTPRLISATVDEYVLGRNPKALACRVSYSDLKKMTHRESRLNIDYPVVLFHRYLGCSSKLYENYQYYVDLTDQLKEKDYNSARLSTSLLAIFALTTSGQRGANGLDVEPIFSYLDSVDAPEALAETLNLLAGRLDAWEVKPNLNEITAIIKLLDQSEKSADELLDLFESKLSVKTLKAFVLWDKNEVHLPANQFIQLYEKLQVFDSDNIDWLAQIAALIRAPYSKAEVSTLLQTLETLKETENYRSTLKIFAAINLNETAHTALPTIQQLNTTITSLLSVADRRAAFLKVAEALDGCCFDLASVADMPPGDLSQGLLDKITKLNSDLRQYGINEDLDVDKLMGGDAASYLNAFVKNLELQAVEHLPGGKRAWTALKATGQPYKMIMDALHGALFGSIAYSIEQVPKLYALQQSFFPEPKLSRKFSHIGEDFVKLGQYVVQTEALFATVISLQKKWPNDFSMDFLLNSPRSYQFSAGDIHHLLKPISTFESSHLPRALLSTIFSNKPLPENQVPAKVAKRIAHVIDTPAFSMSQRTALVNIVINNPTFADDLVDLLNVVKTKHSDILDDCFKLFSKKVDETIIPQVSYLTELLENSPEAKQLIFSKLANKTSKFQQLVRTVREVSEGQRLGMAKVFAYGCLERDYNDKTHGDIFGIDNTSGILGRLQTLAAKHPANFNKLMKLFETRPYPRLEKLKLFLDLSLDQVDSFVADYEFDPPGLRRDGKAITAQFDLSSVAAYIDQIVDLSRERPLYYTHRQTLLDQLVYVNGVGFEYPLVIPGSLENKADYQKPAKDLTKIQLQGLIKHYRLMISNADTDARDLQLAKLEAVALTREAMYRTSGKCPYAIQIMSLLNVMLHGGSSFSEIRTGEGKGLTTALFAMSKWMEGRPVDVCSSNLELASRDLKEFSDFYEYLDVGVTFVRANSDFADYQPAGINYSDISELALFQEKVSLQLKELPKEISIILDEADFAALDNTTQFRYATSLNKSVDPYHNSYEWVYPIILDFVKNKAEFLDKKCSSREDINHLRKFAINHKALSTVKKSQFAYLPDEQLDKWIDSAYIASKLVKDEDFVIRETTLERGGDTVSAQVARVKINHRENKGSTFSNGVHQFLHTRLNLEIEKGELAGDRFLIDPEKAYLASKSAKNFIDGYHDVLGLTGTVGSMAEIQEMKMNYGFKFFKIPPRKTLLRVDHAPVLAGVPRWSWGGKRITAKEAHFKKIYQQVKKCQRLCQPVLLVCDGVESSQALYDFLASKVSDESLQLYNGEQEVDEEVVTDNAGLSGMITVSTPMLGRGTDIKPQSLDGLYVIDTFISSERDFGQVIGRSGRNGICGDSQLIVSEAEFDQHNVLIPNKKMLGSAVAEIRLKLSKETASERIERQSFADVKDQFFNQYIHYCRIIKASVESSFKAIRGDFRPILKTMQHSNYLQWGSFLTTLDARWNELLVQLKNQLKADQGLNEDEQLKKIVNQLAGEANENWGLFRVQLEAKANEVFLRRFAETKASLQETNGVEITQEDQAVSEIKLPSFEAKAFKPLITTLLKPPLIESASMLNGASVNSAAVYTKLSRSLDEKIILQSLMKELEISAKALAPVQASNFRRNIFRNVIDRLFKRRKQLSKNILFKHQSVSRDTGGESGSSHMRENLLTALYKFCMKHKQSLLAQINEKLNVTSADALSINKIAMRERLGKESGDTSGYIRFYQQLILINQEGPDLISLQDVNNEKIIDRKLSYRELQSVSTLLEAFNAIDDLQQSLTVGVKAIENGAFALDSVGERLRDFVGLFQSKRQDLSGLFSSGLLGAIKATQELPASGQRAFEDVLQEAVSAAETKRTLINTKEPSLDAKASPEKAAQVLAVPSKPEKKSTNILTVCIAGTGNDVHSKNYVFRNILDNMDAESLAFNGPGEERFDLKGIAAGRSDAKLDVIFKRIKTKIERMGRVGKINFVGHSRGAVDCIALLNKLAQDVDCKDITTSLFAFSSATGHGKKAESQFCNLPESVDNAVFLVPEKKVSIYAEQDVLRWSVNKNTKLQILDMPGGHSDCLRIKTKDGSAPEKHVAYLGHALLYRALENNGVKFSEGAKFIPVVQSISSAGISKSKFSHNVSNTFLDDPKKMIDIYSHYSGGDQQINDHHRFLLQNAQNTTQKFIRQGKTAEAYVTKNFKVLVTDVCDLYLKMTNVFSDWFGSGQRKLARELADKIKNVDDVASLQAIIQNSMKDMKQRSRLYRALDALLNGSLAALQQMDKRNNVAVRALLSFYRMARDGASALFKSKKLSIKVLPKIAPNTASPGVSSASMAKQIAAESPKQAALMSKRSDEIKSGLNEMKAAIKSGQVVSENAEVHLDALQGFDYKSKWSSTPVAWHNRIKKLFSHVIASTGNVSMQYGNDKNEFDFYRKSNAKNPIKRIFFSKKALAFRRESNFALSAISKAKEFKPKDKEYALAQFAVAIVFGGKNSLKEGLQPLSLSGGTSYELSGVNADLLDYFSKALNQVLKAYHVISGEEKTIKVLTTQSETPLNFSTSNSVSELPRRDERLSNVLSLWLTKSAMSTLAAAGASVESSQRPKATETMRPR